MRVCAKSILQESLTIYIWKNRIKYQSNIVYDEEESTREHYYEKQ